MYAYGYKLNGIIFIVSGYDDWDECYDDYCHTMEELADDLNMIGSDLSKCQWRGVFDADEIRHLV